jgi:hypothetical protein
MNEEEENRREDCFHWGDCVFFEHNEFCPFECTEFYFKSIEDEEEDR